MAKSLRGHSKCDLEKERLNISKKTVRDGGDVTFCGAECSTVGKWGPEKLDRRRFKDGKRVCKQSDNSELSRQFVCSIILHFFLSYVDLVAMSTCVMLSIRFVSAMNYSLLTYFRIYLLFLC